ncbi:TPA: DNA methylase [Vibrio cholerae]|nr:DNA methylase [Vibrio cholerae]HBK7271383.1 DNA methylase [Vibrio cholerae]HBK7293569.1 DNA methylase [Vibrio cholerae]HBK7297110.1 DNA methylase [Vibrio cholerae]
MKQESLLGNEFESHTSGPVECLGMTFENDEARRAHFTELLKEKLKDPEFRAIEGFPIGTDEAILELSDPPYYTACPNPFFKDVVRQKGHDNHYENLQPFAFDVSEGKNTAIYTAHSYHTKVPPKAISKYILHYTKPGDVILDAFSGSGMTGVAARLCQSIEPLELAEIRKDIPHAEPGTRTVLLNELAPAASYISAGYNIPANNSLFVHECRNAIEEVSKELGWMYETFDSECKKPCPINYVIWSDVFSCPECQGELVFWDVAIDRVHGKPKSAFNCTHCQSLLNKKKLNRVWVTTSNHVDGRFDRQPKKEMVEINYTCGKKTKKKKPDQQDFERFERILNYKIDDWFPADKITPGDKKNEPIGLGITHQDLFFTKRNLLFCSKIWSKLKGSKSRFVFTSLVMRLTKLSNLHISNYFNGGGGAASGNMKGMLHPPTISLEQNPIKYWPIRVNAILGILHSDNNCFVSTGSSTNLKYIDDSSVDYIFVDPPFGSNLSYSDLNVVWEGWLNVITSVKEEAIVSSSQKKTISVYQKLITDCFSELYRVLKPGKWITVEFSNTKASVWVSLQQALESCGFIVANVAVLNKKQGGYNSNVYAGAVKQDLAISAYKSSDVLEQKFDADKGSMIGVFDFVEEHLKNLPIAVRKGNELDVIVERTAHQLFDRMVAFHVQRGISVPISFVDFSMAIQSRFECREGMFFLPEQVHFFEKELILCQGIKQMDIFVKNEESAIFWLRGVLKNKPKTYAELHTDFMQEISKWSKSEEQMELGLLLEQNFVKYSGIDEVPSQIHTYLSTNFKDMRGLDKSDPKLKAKAKDRWYVPDPNKAADLEKVRLRALLKEFESYKAEKKKIKQPRAEALRAGFNSAWEAQDFQTILDVSAKIPPAVLQEDEKLLMFYDNALTLTTTEDDEW